DLGRAGHRGAANGATRHRAPDVPGPQPPHVPDQPVGDPVGGAHPVRIAETPAPPPAGLGAPGIGEVLGLRIRAAPAAPPPRLSTGPEEHVARALPVEGDEVEA